MTQMHISSQNGIALAYGKHRKLTKLPFLDSQASCDRLAWFSHEVYTSVEPPPSKESHYSSILSPPPPQTFIESLVDPISLSECIDTLRMQLNASPDAIVGEIGIDKPFRLPYSSPTTANPLALSPYHVSIPHQSMIFEAQLELAMAMNRPISIHGVGQQGRVYDIL